MICLWKSLLKTSTFDGFSGDLLAFGAGFWRPRCFGLLLPLLLPPSMSSLSESIYTAACDLLFFFPPPPPPPRWCIAWSIKLGHHTPALLQHSFLKFFPSFFFFHLFYPPRLLHSSLLLPVSFILGLVFDLAHGALEDLLGAEFAGVKELEGFFGRCEYDMRERSST